MQFFENEIKEYADFAWSTLDLKITPSSGKLDESLENPVTGSIQISGHWQGVVTLSIEYDLAQQLADKMFSREKGQANDEEICDAVCEMVNMIGGNLKSLLPQPNQLSLPIVDLKGALLFFPFTERLSQVGFDCMGKKFMVTIHQNADEKLQNPPVKAATYPVS